MMMMMMEEVEEEDQRGGTAETPMPTDGEEDVGQEEVSVTVDHEKLNHMSDVVTSCHDEAFAEGSTEAGQNEDPVGPQTPTDGRVVVMGNQKTSAIEKLERVRKWSITTYKCTRQVLSEKMGRGSRTVDPDLDTRVDILRDDRRRYDNVTRLAQTLATQLAQVTLTQKTLGDAFADLSLKTPPLHVEFGVNADTQKFLSKSGETVVAAINTFTTDMNTLVNKTIEDTMLNIKHYEMARVEYDAYRCDLEELNLGPRDASTLPKLEQAQRTFQDNREKYERARDDLSIKLKLLEENKVKVLHQQLMLLHSAVASSHTATHQHLEHQANTRLNTPRTEAPSWLEDS